MKTSLEDMADAAVQDPALTAELQRLPRDQREARINQLREQYAAEGRTEEQMRLFRIAGHLDVQTFRDLR